MLIIGRCGCCFSEFSRLQCHQSDQKTIVNPTKKKRKPPKILSEQPPLIFIIEIKYHLPIPQTKSHHQNTSFISKLHEKFPQY